jgi:hypothetical protein
MKHTIEHEQEIDGIIYKIVKEEDVEGICDFYWNYFWPGKLFT